MSFKSEKALNLYRHHLVVEIDNLKDKIAELRKAQDYSYASLEDKREFLIEELISLTRIEIGVDDEHLGLLLEAMKEERERELELPWEEEEDDE